MSELAASKVSEQLRTIRSVSDALTIEEKGLLFNDVLEMTITLSDACIRNSKKETKEERESGEHAPFWALVNVAGKLGIK